MILIITKFRASFSTAGGEGDRSGFHELGKKKEIHLNHTTKDRRGCEVSLFEKKKAATVLLGGRKSLSTQQLIIIKI